MKKLILMIYVAGAVLLALQSAAAKVQVVAATSDLASFAREIGGDLVEVEAIARPNADVHFVEVRPSYMVKVRRADLVLRVGLDLDQWMEPIIGGSRNGKVKIVDCSAGVQRLEVPTSEVDARLGDVHRFGNPHYWLTPDNVPAITEAIVDGLARVDPANAETYRANRKTYLEKLDTGLKELAPEVERLQGVEIVTYHNSWPYFDQYTGLDVVGFVEPYPGVPPSPTHIRDLTAQIKERGIKVIGVEPYFDRRVPDRIAEETGARVVTLYPSVGGRDKSESYLGALSGNVRAILEALHK